MSHSSPHLGKRILISLLHHKLACTCVTCFGRYFYSTPQSQPALVYSKTGRNVLGGCMICQQNHLTGLHKQGENAWMDVVDCVVCPHTVQWSSIKFLVHNRVHTWGATLAHQFTSNESKSKLEDWAEQWKRRMWSSHKRALKQARETQVESI